MRNVTVFPPYISRNYGGRCLCAPLLTDAEGMLCPARRVARVYHVTRIPARPWTRNVTAGRERKLAHRHKYPRRLTRTTQGPYSCFTFSAISSFILHLYFHRPLIRHLKTDNTRHAGTSGSEGQETRHSEQTRAAPPYTRSPRPASSCSFTPRQIARCCTEPCRENRAASPFILLFAGSVALRRLTSFGSTFRAHDKGEWGSHRRITSPYGSTSLREASCQGTWEMSLN